MTRLIHGMGARGWLAGVALLAVGLAGCTSPLTAPSFARFSQTDLRAGTGDVAAQDGHLLTVHYTGWLYDPTQPDDKGAAFDSSLLSTAPFTFTLGQGDVIDGWEQGIRGMRSGGLRRLVVPPSQAYGAVRNNLIPPFATLVFEIELLSIQ